MPSPLPPLTSLPVLFSSPTLATIETPSCLNIPSSFVADGMVSFPPSPTYADRVCVSDSLSKSSLFLLSSCVSAVFLLLTFPLPSPFFFAGDLEHMLFGNVEVDFSPTGAVSPYLEAGYFSLAEKSDNGPFEKSDNGPSPMGSPLMDLDENFEEELASSMESPRNALDAISSTDHSDEGLSEGVPSRNIL